MSEIRVNTFKAEDGISAPSFPNGIQVTGVVTSTSLQTSVDFLDVGSNIKAGNSGILTVTELKATNVSVAGTLTYEDVTNVDSVGVVTARTGLKVTSGEATVGSNIKLGNAGVVTATAFHGSGASLTGIDETALKDPSQIALQLVDYVVKVGENNGDHNLYYKAFKQNNIKASRKQVAPLLNRYYTEKSN